MEIIVQINWKVYKKTLQRSPSLWAMIYMASGESPFIVTVFGERLEMLFLVEDGSQLL